MKFVKTLCIAILVLVSCKEKAEQKVVQEQPNILWLLTDDQRYDAVSAFNQILHGRKNSALGYVESPNVDRLATMGTTFINTYCQAQVCAPSRASMHLGRYPFRSGVYQFEYYNNVAEHTKPTLPESMKDLGYQTLHVGKLGVRLRSFIGDSIFSPQIYQTDITDTALAGEGLCEWAKETVYDINGETLDTPTRMEFMVDSTGKYYYFSKELEDRDVRYKGMAQEAHDKFQLLRYYNHERPHSIYQDRILAGASPQPAGKTKDGYYNRAMLKFLDNENKMFNMGSLSFKGADPSKPLFCHLGYDLPHAPVLPPSEYRERFKKHNYKIPELTDEEWQTMPAQLKHAAYNMHSNHMTDEEKHSMIQDYFALCAYGDRLIGEATDAFITYSEKHNQPWVIVYVCGDHGWKLNDHGAITKTTPWEVDSHNPIIVVSSDKTKFPEGKVVKDYTEFVDISPTILAAGGADIASEKFTYLDGMDLSKVANGKAPVRDYVIGESHTLTGPRAYIRTKDYVLSIKTRPNIERGVDMNWALNASYEDLDPGLYHTTKDPNEIKNVAFDKDYEAIAMKMKDKLLNIVLGDNRVEIMWAGDEYGKSTKAIGTKVHRSNFAPGAHDYKLTL